ncbi:S-layer homology domain-containing protein [Sporosarcina sp. FSL K6-1540]|uniref:S-layer homology domain-containing protein n=1 Tax=Sporosarcina sp. FSL K6-1540 TaxID=2921555 RepID=UPI003159CEDF
MANQPSKYSKFLVGAASAALVASAVAPVASAADFKDTKGNTHEEAINALSDSGVIKGYSDGTFLPNKTLTRSDVVKMMGKWLVTEGHAIPADARTNPRFTDLSTKSNAELLDYAAVVKDAGVFIGSNGKLLAVDNITRENMALVLVRAFDTVEKIDLATYVAGQDFKRDVKDLTSAKSEARAAIDVLDFFDITNPTVASFNPKGNTTRGHFATFLHKTINADFSKVAGEAAEGVVSVKAVNATTVEVAFKEELKDVSALKFSIEGLAISNAAVKQTDSKVLVLTTAAQTGDKEYTLKSGESTLGKFKGISGVIPTKITMNTTSTQGVVGKEVTLKADIGVKEAGVPVTFNVSAGSKLNKDHIEEVTTNAEGIATYSYTQYVSGESDDVVAYPTGAPAVRSLATVYWGVDTILAITPTDDKQGNSVANGANKVYKVTSKDPKTGKAVANQKLHVTFVENVGVTIDKTSKATVNGTNPMQLSNGTAAVTAEVVTDSKGEATFTVSGHNTTVTPVVFPNQVVNKEDVNAWEATKLQAQAAEKVVFGATQADYVIDVTRSGEEAARYEANGREYKVVLKTKDGKVAANELVNIAFNEDIDRNINTNTEAYFTDDDKKILVDSKTVSQHTVKTDAKGEATFTISSDKEKDYATPIAWIDINTSNAKEGKFDDGEPFKIAPITYFAEAKLTDGTVKAYKTDGKDYKEFTGLETATFKFTAANQSGKAMGLPTGYSHIEASFTVFNTGANDVTVDGHVVSPNRSYTTTKVVGTSTSVPSIEVKSDKDKTTSVRVVASGTAISNNTTDRAINLGNHEAVANFTSTSAIGVIHTGIVESIDTIKKDIKFVGKDKMSYKDASFKNVNAVSLTQAEFETLVKANEGTAKVTVKKDGDKFIFEIVSLNPNLSSTLEAINEAVTDAAVVTALDNSGFVPAFSALNAAQKLTVANAVRTQRAVGGVTVYTETRLKTVYTAQYAAVVATAIGNVNTAATAANLAAVPGLNLTAYNALSAADKTLVEAILDAGTFADVAALQAAIPAAIAKNEVDKGQVGVNTALGLINTALNKASATATTAELANAKTVLTTNASIVGLDLTAFNAATAHQDAVLGSIMTIAGPSTYTAAGLQTALNNAVAVATDLTAPTVTKAEFNATTGDLVLTFSENVNVSATAAGTIDFKTSANLGGTVATPATSATTATKITIALTKVVADAQSFGVDSKINGFTNLTIADAAGNPLAITGLNVTVTPVTTP